MATAVYPGSFNPVHPGHLHVIAQAARMFEHVIVLLAVNPAKKYDVPVSTRKNIVEEAVSKLSNVQVDTTELPLAEYCARDGLGFVVRGLRNGNDFESEQTQEAFVKLMNNDLQYVYLGTPPEIRHLSSTAVRQFTKLTDFATFLQIYANGFPEVIVPSIETVRKIYSLYRKT